MAWLCTLILRTNPKEGVMRHLPQIAVWIGKVAGVTAPEHLLSRFHQPGTCCDSLFHEFVNCHLRIHVMRHREASEPVAVGRYPHVFRQRFPPIQSQPAAIECEECNLWR